MRRSVSALLIGLGLVLVAALATQLSPTHHAGAAAQEIAPEIDAEFDPDLPVALVADTIGYDSETRRITAEGNVEVFYGDRTLTADRITYDDTTGRIEAEGDLVLRDPTGFTVFADFADLDAQLRDGVVRGAQSMLDQQTRLSAVEARRVDDRYNILNRAVYSPCEVCEDDPTPLWRIRARRVIHDQEERVIHYENARLEVFGVPVFWTPYFSHPDPTVDRVSGFLAPEAGADTENYGYGVKIPFYWVIDEHTDVTLTPFVTTNDGVVGLLEARRAFSNGDIFFSGSIARSDFTGDREQHGHVDTFARFTSGPGIVWGWDVAFASDDGYLRYFDLSTEDRLTQEVFANRYRRAGFFDVSGVRFQSLRNNEPAGQIPLVIPDFAARQEFAAPYAGGTLGLFADSQGLYRNNGEDTGRISVGIDWEREFVLPVGLALTAFAEARGDLFLIGDRDDPDLDDTVLRFAPLAGLEARYPLVSTGNGSITQVIEPIAQAIVAPFGGNGDDIPNEDSLITEFDELSIFERNHFSGLDGYEEGPRLNVGLRYAVLSDTGLNLDTTVGRVLRFDDADEFTSGSGLQNAVSDWVAGFRASYDPYVTLQQRVRLDGDEFSVTRSETRLGLQIGPAGLDLQYVFFEEEPEAGAAEDREELFARARLALTDEWGVSGFVRRDLEEREFVTLGGAVRFANECCAVSFFGRRNFTSQDNVSDGTSFGLRVELFTLGGVGFEG